MKVLHVGKFYPPVSGGMEKVVQVLCESERPAVDSRVLVAHTSPATVHETVNGVPVTRAASVKKIGAVALCPSFPYWMRRLAADVMVIHEPNPLAIVAHALVSPRSRLIFWVHAEVVRPQWRYRLFYRPFLRRCLRRAAHIVVASPAVAALAVELQPHRHKCVVIPYAIDPDRHRLEPGDQVRVDVLRSDRAESLVLFVGRMVTYKGVDVLLKALVHTRARAVLVGDGPMRNAWERMAGELGISDRVRFAGEVADSELRILYNACDLFVLPSVTRAEAFGVVQLEAMACRKPVICTELPSGVPWVNQHDETGLVVPAGDATALALAINRLAADATLRRTMGERGRARVLAHFTVPRFVEQTSSLYRSALAAPAAGPAAVVPFGKRLLDLGLSGAGLIASTPVWLALAAAITIEDGGPVFYTQDRVGERGRIFKVFKFRSMIPDAEAATGAVQATEHDPRVTKIGRLMRATAMDELPQLLNIFRGDMSFVGPRALRPGESDAGTGGAIVAIEAIEGYAERQQIRPGLTGVAQIYARRDVTRRHKFKFDRLYARQQSFGLDVRLILLSFWITLRGRWEHRAEKI